MKILYFEFLYNPRYSFDNMMFDVGIMKTRISIVWGHSPIVLFRYSQYLTRMITIRVANPKVITNYSIIHRNHKISRNTMVSCSYYKIRRDRIAIVIDQNKSFILLFYMTALKMCGMSQRRLCLHSGSTN